jgi:hypothetical protein
VGDERGVPLSWAGASLLVVATGTALPREQWGVLAVGLGGQMLWSMSIPLVLLVGLVLLAGAPFHFWAADLFQGARAWLAPLAIAALQVCGVAWVENRLEVVEAFESAAAIAGGLLGVAAATALVVGALTLLWQRRPERRVGTLASLHGGLALAWLAAEHATYRPTPPAPGLFEAWASHLVLALTGAAVLARLTPVPGERSAPPAVLFRRHSAAGVAGLYALASLAGVPGTPGAAVWLAVARELVASGRTAVLLALGFAWLASFAFAMQQVRDSFGVPPQGTPPENPVPRVLRSALWLAGGGLAALGAMQWIAAPGASRRGDAVTSRGALAARRPARLLLRPVRDHHHREHAALLDDVDHADLDTLDLLRVVDERELQPSGGAGVVDRPPLDALGGALVEVHRRDLQSAERAFREVDGSPLEPVRQARGRVVHEAQVDDLDRSVPAVDQVEAKRSDRILLSGERDGREQREVYRLVGCERRDRCEHRDRQRELQAFAKRFHDCLPRIVRHDTRTRRAPLRQRVRGR